jgi:hypothetical protein
MDVRLGVLQFPTGADGRYRRAFGHAGAPLDCERPEVEERDGVPVRSLDRERPPTSWNRPCEGDCPRGGRAHRAAGGGADVDAAVLTTRVGVVAEIELSKHRPVHGPGPGERGLHADLEREEDRKQDDEALHRLFPPRCQFWKLNERSSPAARCQFWLQRIAIEAVA